MYGSVHAIEGNFKILTQTVDEYEQKTLTVLGSSERIVGIDNIYYASLQSAVNICPTDGTEKTIALYKSVELSDLVLIEEGQNIVISLSGFKLTYNGTEITNANKSTAFTIDSDATLTITD